MENDRIISALIGLIGACNNNQKTENTDHVVIKSLAFSCQNNDDASLQEIIDEIYAEKYAVSPGCAMCAMPCGNTSDYDMNRIYDAEEEIRQAKLNILEHLQELAAYIIHQTNRITLSESDKNMFYKALSYVSYDTGKDDLSTLLNEIYKTKEKIRRYLES